MTTVLNARQILRTRGPLQVGKQRIPTGTRVFVMGFPRDQAGRVKVQVADPERPKLEGVQVVTTPAHLQEASRGRPMGTTKDVLEARRAARRAAQAPRKRSKTTKAA